MFLFYDKSLNKPLTEQTYAANCEFTVENLWNATYDRYFLSHFLGWVCKSIMLRDSLFCWTISIGWELIEIAFTHMLPNFAECWWDQWLLDVLIANGLGIYVGTTLCRYLEVKHYNWSELYKGNTLVTKAKRMVLQFTPSSWMKVDWESTGHIKQFLIYNVLMFCLHINELSAFFLKAILWLPPSCNLNLIRLILWWVMGLVTFRQIYMYLTNPRIHRLGSQYYFSII